MCSLLHVLRRNSQHGFWHGFLGSNPWSMQAGSRVLSRVAYWVSKSISRFLMRNCLGVLTPDPAFLPRMPSGAYWVLTGCLLGAYRVLTGCLPRIQPSAQGVHRECTGSAPGVHRECTGSAPGVHRECTGS